MSIARGGWQAEAMQLLSAPWVVPILAPTLGGMVLSVASWRWIFWIATIYGVISLALVAWKLPDTLPRGFNGIWGSLNQRATEPKPEMRNCIVVVDGSGRLIEAWT